MLGFAAMLVAQLWGIAPFTLLLSCLTTSFRDRCASSQARRPSIVVTPLPFPALSQAKVGSNCLPVGIAAFLSPAASLCPVGLGLPVSVASSIYPTTNLNLHLSLQLVELSESCRLPPHSQPVCQLLCSFSTHFSPALTFFFTSRGPAPVWQPFHPSSFSPDTFYTVGCQGTVSTSVCCCHLTPSFHPRDPKPPENVLFLLLFFPFLCFGPSCILYSSCNSS